jgi:hypothetical protein
MRLGSPSEKWFGDCDEQWLSAAKTQGQSGSGYAVPVRQGRVTSTPAGAQAVSPKSLYLQTEPPLRSKWSIRATFCREHMQQLAAHDARKPTSEGQGPFIESMP